MDIITGIKIYEGTCLEIDFHDFFDVNKRDLTDDLCMAQLGDKRDTNLFTKVSNQKTSHLHFQKYISLMKGNKKYQP